MGRDIKREEAVKSIKNRVVTVIGLGKSGLSSCRLLKKAGAVVRATDKEPDPSARKEAELLRLDAFETGGHTKDFITSSDMIVVSPGVDPRSPCMVWASEAGVPVISELELGYLFCPAPIVAISGTNGKSTAASLLHHILVSNGIRSHLLGNIGRPLCEDIYDISAEDTVVSEVSSFQLESINAFRPSVAVLLNISQDHLDRYCRFEDYVRAKEAIFKNQKWPDAAILNADDTLVKSSETNKGVKRLFFSLEKTVPGAFARGGKLFLNLEGRIEQICFCDDIPLKGAHNLSNVLAASVAARLINDSLEIERPIRNFRPLRHRFNFVAEIDGVTFIDDSKSTTAVSTLRGLEGFSDRRVILIAGGKDKGVDFTPVLRAARSLKGAILIGEAAGRIRRTLAPAGIKCEDSPSLETAVLRSMELAERGDTVLLSPMCSSFDMFSDYAERGEVFRRSVAVLSAER